jgi:queuosine precursor transporter
VDFPFANELLWSGFLLLDMCVVVLVYRLFGREGLMCYLVFALIACNIEVLKLVHMFGLTVTLGNILYGSIFLTTDILTELHGKKAAQKAIWLGFVTLIMMTAFMQISLAMQPAKEDWAHGHLAALFSFLPRIAVASLTAYLVAQLCDVTIFVWIRRLTGEKLLWLRNNGSTIFSQMIDTAIFSVLAFAPISLLGAETQLPWATVWEIAWTTYVLKLIVALVDTPFIYLARGIAKRNFKDETYDWSAERLQPAAQNA